MADNGVGVEVKGAFFGALALIVLACITGESTVGWLVTLPVVLLLLFAMTRAPLRTSLLTLMFFALVLENPSDMPAAGAWRSPFFYFGGVMLVHLKKSVDIPLPFSGVDLCLVTLAIVHFMRRSSGSKLDRANQFPTPLPLIRLAQVSLAGTLFVWLLGLSRGGQNWVALWQIDKVMYVPIVFLLFQAGLRGPRDHAAIAKVVLGAGVLRAVQAGFVRATVFSEPDPQTGEVMAIPYATTHHDSVLFAAACVLLVVMVMERVGRSPVRRLLFLFPILAWGMWANQRRLVWLQLLAVLLVLYFVTAMNAFKRKLQRTLLIAAPVLALYVALGWNRATGVFKPVATIRSTVDSEGNASTQWRDVENFDLLSTIKLNPIFGTGYGHPFWEVIPLPAVDYELERFIPHNSILGLWAYCGYVGYTAMTLLWGTGVYFAMRGYHHGKTPNEKAGGLAAFGIVPIYYLQCYGDMGLGSWEGVFLMAPALATAGKLAVATGAWPAAGVKLPGASGPSVRSVPTGPAPGRRPVPGAAPSQAAK